MRRHHAVLLSLAFGIISYCWLEPFYGAQGGDVGSKFGLVVVGLPAIACGLCLVALLRRHRFLPVAAAALAMLAALPVTLYPFSNDVAFYAGKTLWASLGSPWIDPVIGVPTGYPPVFHTIWGQVMRLTGESAMEALRWASIWDLLALWIICRTAWKSMLRAEETETALFVLGLSFFFKEQTGYLFASAACFSMPFAIWGWWVWSQESSMVKSLSGALSLGASIILWPAHIFCVCGIALVTRRQALLAPRTWAYTASVVAAAGITWLLRATSTIGESWSGLTLVPDDLMRFLAGRVLAIATLGSDAHGPIVTAGALLINAALVFLAVLCSRSGLHARMVGTLWRTCIGLFVGSLLAAWFMIQAAFAIRLAFLAAVMIVPIAGIGLEYLISTWACRVRTHVASACRLAMGAVWLVPILVGTSVTSYSYRVWDARMRPATEYLQTHAADGQRVWATPETFCWIVLGRAPLLGFLAHDWPLYYGAPVDRAEAFAAAYTQLYENSDPDRCFDVLAQAGVDWVVLDSLKDQAAPLYSAVTASTVRPVHAVSGVFVYDVSASAGDIRPTE